MFGKSRSKEAIREAEVAEFKEVPLSFKEKVKKYGKIALGCIVLLAVLVITLMIVFREKKAPQVFVYVDENNCLYTGEVKKPQKSKMWTENYLAEDCNSMVAIREDMVQFTADGSKIYYPAEVKEDGSFSLYVSEYKGGEAAGELLIQDVMDYEVAKTGKVICLKSDGSLNVLSDIEINCLSFHAEYFWVDESGKNIIWQEPEENGSEQCQFFFQNLNLKKEKKKLQGGVTTICSVSEDLKTIYFEKDDNLYRIKNQGDKEKIAENIDLYDYDSTREGFYYTKGAFENLELYYFDGKESTQVAEDVLQLVEYGDDVCLYAANNEEVSGGMKLYIAKKDAVSRVDMDSAKENLYRYQAVFDEAGEQIYVFDLKTNAKGNLSVISYAEGNVGIVETIDNGVDSLNIESDGKLYYIKDVYTSGSTYLGDVYSEGELVQESTVIGKTEAVQNSLFFYEDWDGIDRAGTLMRLKDEKVKQVAENVNCYIPQSEKMVFLEMENDGATYTLSYFNGKKVKKIAEGVQEFVIKEN